MPKTISALRRYPTTTFLAFLLFLATLAVATGSLGTVRPGGSGGGGSEDGGSGFGGTGRSGEFGGSGLGGTGMPSPFITLDDSREEAAPAPIPAQAPATDILEPAFATPAGNDQPAVEVAVEMAVDVVPEPKTVVEVALPQTDRIDGGAEIEVQTQPLQPVALPTPIQVVEAATFEPIAPASPAEAAPDEEMAAVQEAPQLVDTLPPIVESEADSTDRNVLPERIQRPELPPFQRVRPVDRATIAAPPPPPQPTRF